MTSKHNETLLQHKVPVSPLYYQNPQETPPRQVTLPPALSLKVEYVKLLFRDNPSVEMKLRWLSEVTKAFRIDHDLTEVKMSSVTSHFVSTSWHRTDIISNVTSGTVLSLFLEEQDSIEMPRKFPYIITPSPVCGNSCEAIKLSSTLFVSFTKT